MKKILTNGVEIIGPYLSIKQVADGYETDTDFIPANVAVGFVIEEVPNDYKTPNEIENEKNAHNAQMKVLRSIAYPKEADPLFFKSQRGEIPEQEWLDKCAEIKLRYPYQE